MSIVACLEAVAGVALVWLLLRHHAEQTAQWALERRELLTRIQRPEMVPTAPVRNFVVPEAEPDDIELVGSIAYLDIEPD